MKNKKEIKKPVFKKIVLHMDCWYTCKDKSAGMLNFSNDDEIPVCLKCAKRHGCVNVSRKRKSSILGNTYEGKQGLFLF